LRKRQDNKPVDVSKALFMDLAFLLIAALVLLVNEPMKQNLGKLEIRTTLVKEVEEVDIDGESLFLRIESDGTLWEEATDEKIEPLQLQQFSQRIGQMKKDGERDVVLILSPDLSYGKIAPVRDALEELRRNKQIGRILELVKTEKR
jgi:biopolymer transport protein ExbD